MSAPPFDIYGNNTPNAASPRCGGGLVGHHSARPDWAQRSVRQLGYCAAVARPSLFPIVLACAALWRRRPDRAARSMRALCLSKFSKGLREFAQVIKKDAAISVGRSEFRGVLRVVAERWSLANRRRLGCRQNRRGGDVGAPGCFLRRG